MDKKPQHFIIKLGFIPFDVMVSINESDVLLQKLLDKFNTNIGVTPMSITTKGRTIQGVNNHTVIRLKTQTDKIEFIGVVAHEAFHAIDMIADRIGVEKQTMISCEVWAYGLQYITTEILKRVKI